ncbi:uncharacterized protein BX664DRAFT_255503 [Halteromyces radiatus]|uniref:uncharacterized protein n=1 Tax=Halteromyces radiatus TaxID=101107 RepID=UPI00221E8047|nr:uncharacterized protein BX664DRAFT_255503 [Halteromyces radiatus]KAI8099287.1 hypothetical protein BX664DRAFT_255503 [Halteromyces radiatus]
MHLLTDILILPFIDGLTHLFFFLRIENFGLWEKDDHESEMTFYRRFATLLDILFKGTQIELADGETGCSSTRPAIEMNKAVFQAIDSGAAYCRKIDLLIKFDGTERLELCSNEWKKSNVSANTVLKQQCKNLRINATILSTLISKYGDKFDKLMAMDWIGHIGYLYVLEKHGDVFVSSLLATMMIPKEAAHLAQMKPTLDNLFLFKVKDRYDMD